MARPDLWGKIKGTFQISTTGPGTPKRFRLTDHALDSGGGGSSHGRWRPWDAVAVDAQHLSGTVYVAFNGTTATSTLATAVYDDTRTSFRIYPRTRMLFPFQATSVSIITSGTDVDGTPISCGVARFRATP